MHILLFIFCVTPFVIWGAKSFDDYLQKKAVREVNLMFPKRGL